MTEHCDNCGTELDPDQPRHQRYRLEPVDDPDPEKLQEGRLCADCVVEFERWLDAEASLT